MSELHAEQLNFFPLPFSRGGQQHDGCLIASPPKCDACELRECEPLATNEVFTCRFGLNFTRLDAGTVVNGFLIDAQQNPTRAWVKNRRRLRDNVVRSSVLHKVLTVRDRTMAATDEVFRERIQRAVAEFQATPEFKTESFAHLGPQFERQLGQVHDYRALVSAVVQNVNVLLNAKSADELDAKLDTAGREIQAIYWAARAMEMRLNAALFFEYPERIRDPHKSANFRFHGLIRKYEKMYEGGLQERDIAVRRSGQCFGFVRCNPEAFAVIPHTLIENAAKYSPSGVELYFRYGEDESNVSFEVKSLGPRIHADERREIFELFKRGRDAVAAESEGTGFGLALAKLVAEEIGCRLEVSQDDDDVDGFRWTTFRVEMPKV